jgi:hypothetical protein
MSTEVQSQLPDAEILLSSETPVSPDHLHSNLVHYAGDLATKAVILAQIKADQFAHTATKALETVSGAIRIDTPHAAMRIVMAGLVCTALIGTFKDPKEAQAATGLATTVIDADGGVFSRRTPHWSDTPSIVGQGFYTGNKVTILCGSTKGDPGGPLNNTTWYYTENNSIDEPPSWLNAHYVDTPEGPGQLAPGVSQCANEGEEPVTGPRIQDVQPNSPSAVFFIPRAGMHNVDGLTDNSDVLKVEASDWAGSADSCSDAHVVAQVPVTAHTLAGWSNARLGPVYFLAAANREQIDRIHTIILFDPGNTSNFKQLSPLERAKNRIRHADGSQNCDFQYDINGLLANWLASNPSNRLVVMTGRLSEMKTDDADPNSKSNYSGLWHYYFSGIWHNNNALQGQALVCDYNYLGHTEIMQDYGYIIASPPADACPAAIEAQHPLTAWRP